MTVLALVPAVSALPSVLYLEVLFGQRAFSSIVLDLLLTSMPYLSVSRIPIICRSPHERFGVVSVAQANQSFLTDTG